MKIIVTESIAMEGIQSLIDSGFDVDVKFGIDREELLACIDQYDAVIVRSVTKINEELLERASRLKVVGRAGNGVDNISLAACTQRGIIVVNTPESNIMAAAELAVAHAFNAFRNLTRSVIAGKGHDFRRGNFIGNELDDKTVGIIGLGRIGTIVAKKLKGCNMHVIAYDPYITEDCFKNCGARRCDTLDELLRESDLITIHTPKTPETIGIIGAEEIAKCKDGVRLVNAARGGLINEQALYEGLVSGKVAYAGLDVLDPEPNYNRKPEEQDYKNPLLELDNISITPHLGASTYEANYNVGTAVTKLVGQALNGEMVPAVNMPPVKAENMEELRPYLELAEMMGKIYYQVEKQVVKAIEITYSGDLAEQDTDIITLSAMKGFLQPIVESRVNYVNARMILDSMGVNLTEKKTTKLEKYTNLISIKFISDQKSLSVSGTVFAKSEIRIVDFFGYKMDFEPTDNVIAIHNQDVPGMIGKIGTVLGANGININAMQWSSNPAAGRAESFVSVDRPVAKDILRQIAELDGVLKVSPIAF